MIALIKRCIFAFNYKRAVNKAIKLYNATGLKYYVIYLNGSIKVVPKKSVKQLISNHRFKKGVRIEDIEKHALFVTK